MKSFIFTSLLLLGALSQSVNAQDVEKREFLFGGDKPLRISGFGAPIIEFSSVAGDFSVSTGGGGAVLFNQCFFIGGYGLGTVNTGPENFTLQIREFDLDIHTYTNLRRMFGHGGLWLGYIHNSHKAIHMAVSTKIGGGAVGYYDFDFNNWNTDLGWDAVFVFTPQVEIEMNLLKWFKVNVGVGYRLVSGINETYTNADGEEQSYFRSTDFSSPQASVSLMFGGFGK